MSTCVANQSLQVTCQPGTRAMGMPGFAAFGFGFGVAGAAAVVGFAVARLGAGNDFGDTGEGGGGEDRGVPGVWGWGWGGGGGEGEGLAVMWEIICAERVWCWSMRRR